MKLETTLNQSMQWLNACNDLVDGMNFKSTERKRISAGLFHLSMEHQGAIHLLTVNKHYGSAFAMLRPQLEAFIRGAWYQHCASDEDIAKFQRHEEPPKINRLIREIEATPAYLENTLKEIKDNAWSTLCSYTHGGFYQVSNRNTENEISCNYDTNHIIDLINQSCSITLLTMNAISILLDNQEMAEKLLPLYEGIFV